jgi:hypothetical protein
VNSAVVFPLPEDAGEPMRVQPSRAEKVAVEDA